MTPHLHEKKSRFAELEAIIQTALDHDQGLQQRKRELAHRDRYSLVLRFQAGVAAKEIKEGKLYRGNDHRSFAAYCRIRFERGKSSIYSYIRLVREIPPEHIREGLRGTTAAMQAARAPSPACVVLFELAVTPPFRIKDIKAGVFAAKEAERLGKPHQEIAKEAVEAVHKSRRADLPKAPWQGGEKKKKKKRNDPTIQEVLDGVGPATRRCVQGAAELSVAEAEDLLNKAVVAQGELGEMMKVLRGVVHGKRGNRPTLDSAGRRGPALEPEPEPKPEPEIMSEPDPRPEPAPDPQPEPEPQPGPMPEGPPPPSSLLGAAAQARMLTNLRASKDVIGGAHVPVFRGVVRVPEHPTERVDGACILCRVHAKDEEKDPERRHDPLCPFYRGDRPHLHDERCKDNPLCLPLYRPPQE